MEKLMCEPCLVITSWPDLGGARQQANHWVENKLATSVNILPQMDSIYVWEGELRHGTEHKIFIKTCASRLAALQSCDLARPRPCKTRDLAKPATLQNPRPCKTRDLAKPATLQNNIKSAHTNSVAEILHFKINSGDPDYLNWITVSIQ